MEKIDITYRKAVLEDIFLLVDYRIYFLKELQGPRSLEIETQLRTQLTDYFKRGLTDRAFMAWIAEHHGRVVGLGGLVIHEIPGSFKMMKGLKGYILNMYTLPEFRKMGIGAEILNRLVHEGKALGLSKIYLHAAPNGIALYRRNGFVEPDSLELEIALI